MLPQNRFIYSTLCLKGSLCFRSNKLRWKWSSSCNLVASSGPLISIICNRYFWTLFVGFYPKWLDDTRQLNVTQGKTNLWIESILGLVGVGAHLQLERFWSGYYDIRFEQLGTTESVLTGAHSVVAALVNTNKVVSITHSTSWAAEVSHVALKWSSEWEGLRILCLPLDGAKVFLYTNTWGVSQVGQVTSPTIHLVSIVETLDDRRRASEILHTTRRRHVQIITWNHIDLDLPLPDYLFTVRHDWQYNRIGASPTHVNVHCDRNWKFSQVSIQMDTLDIWRSRSKQYLLCWPEFSPHRIGKRSPTVVLTMNESVVQRPFSSGWARVKSSKSKRSWHTLFAFSIVTWQVSVPFSPFGYCGLTKVVSFWFVVPPQVNCCASFEGVSGEGLYWDDKEFISSSYILPWTSSSFRNRWRTSRY